MPFPLSTCSHCSQREACQFRWHMRHVCFQGLHFPISETFLQDFMGNTSGTPPYSSGVLQWAELNSRTPGRSGAVVSGLVVPSGPVGAPILRRRPPHGWQQVSSHPRFHLEKGTVHSPILLRGSPHSTVRSSLQRQQASVTQAGNVPTRSSGTAPPHSSAHLPKG